MPYKDPEKRREYWKKYKRKNPQVTNHRKRTFRPYGLTLEDFDLMMLHQDSCCAICRALPGKRPLSVDHNHKTGAVRKLLCQRCNIAVGYVETHPALLEMAKEYLKDHGTD